MGVFDAIAIIVSLLMAGDFAVPCTAFVVFGESQRRYWVMVIKL